jgi:NitT/TauT family transport system substrate-binding protein
MQPIGGKVRRVALGATAAVVGLAAMAAHAQETVKVGGVRGSYTLPVWVAIDRGFCKEVGLDVEFVDTRDFTQMMSAVVGGSIDFGNPDYISFAAAVGQGLPVKLVATVSAQPTSQADDGAPITVKASSEINGPKDMEGRKFGVTAPQGTSGSQAKEWLKQNGADPDKVQFVAVAPAQMAPALELGDIDAAYIVEPYTTAFFDTGEARAIGYPNSEIFAGRALTGIITTDTYIKDKAETVQKLAGCVREAIEWMNDNDAEARKVLPNYTQIEAGVADKIKLYTWQANATPDDIQKVVDFASEYGLLKTPIKAGDYMHSTVAGN